MKKHYFLIVVVISLFTMPDVTFSQGTYAQVYQLLNTRCTNYACHDGNTATFNALLPADSLYATLINVLPVNPAAASNYNKLVAPGDVQKSFLLRKVAHGISDGLKLNQPSEGLDMPNGLPALKNFEIELVRQWILFGAPDTGTIVDTALINTYYRDGGIDDTYSPHAAPTAGTGFQMYYGRIFLSKNTRDTEFFYKIDPHLTTAIEAKAVSTMMPANDHHFGIWVFQNGTDQIYPWGLRPLSDGSMENVSYGIGTAAGLWNYTLPTGTAFFFPQGQKFDLDLHVQNPSPDSIYSTDLYANFYTQPLGTAQKYMQVNNYPDLNISIPEDGQPHTFTVTGNDSSFTKYWNVWKMYTHTHKYGTAFNVWLRNPDGTKGAQVYNGNYSYELGYDVGWYRWGPHVTFRTWPGDSLLAVDPRSGFIGEATYINTAGPNPCIWGWSAYWEMMDIGFYYVPGDDLSPTAISEPKAMGELKMQVYPNPVSDAFVLSYELANQGNVEIGLADMLGNKIATLVSGNVQGTGKYTREFNASEYKLAKGIYLVTFNIDGKTATQKLIVTD